MLFQRPLNQGILFQRPLIQVTELFILETSTRGIYKI
jgi:hypothetical protein